MDLQNKTIEEKIKLIESLDNHKKNFIELPDFREFLVDCKLLPSQVYGVKIQKRWVKDHQFSGVKSTLNRGDYIDKESYVEFKVSYISDNQWSLLQIRPYQDIDRYDILLIDKDFNYTLYSIPKDEMTKLELDVCHGTKNSNKDNQNIEYRYTIKKNELNKIEKFKSDTTLPEGKFF